MEMGATLKKMIEEIESAENTAKPSLPMLVDGGNNHVPIQQSVVQRARRESFECPYCQAPCALILDAKDPKERLDPGEIDTEDTGSGKTKVQGGTSTGSMLMDESSSSDSMLVDSGPSSNKSSDDSMLIDNDEGESEGSALVDDDDDDDSILI